MSPAPRPLGQILVGEGHITQEQLETALEVQKARGLRLGEVLVDMEYLDEDTYLRALSQQLGFPYWPRIETAVDSAILTMVPIAFIKEHRIYLVRCFVLEAFGMKDIQNGLFFIRAQGQWR